MFRNVLLAAHDNKCRCFSICPLFCYTFIKRLRRRRRFHRLLTISQNVLRKYVDEMPPQAIITVTEEGDETRKENFEGREIIYLHTHTNAHTAQAFHSTIHSVMIVVLVLSFRGGRKKRKMENSRPTGCMI